MPMLANISVFCNTMKIELLVHNVVHTEHEIIIKQRTFLTNISLYHSIIETSHIEATVFVCM